MYGVVKLIENAQLQPGEVKFVMGKSKVVVPIAEQISCLEASQSCPEGLDVTSNVVVVHNQISVPQFVVENDSSDAGRIESGLSLCELFIRFGLKLMVVRRFLGLKRTSASIIFKKISLPV